MDCATRPGAWGLPMFKPMHANGNFLGYRLDHAGKLYFFGSRFVRREDLPRIFPQLEFCFLKQVHGSAVVPADPKLTPEADAQFTSARGRALVAQTADCLPILMSSADHICAVHAGWRGLARNIVSAAAAKIPGVDFAAIGPHIGRASFEVGDDVARELTLAASMPVAPQGLTRPARDPGKVLFDLRGLARLQLTECTNEFLAVAECCDDTKVSLQFHSFRRDRDKAERQYSFVAIV